MTPDVVMIFAAGLGTRMGKMTRDRPKPLIPVGGKALLDHALDLTAAVTPRSYSRLSESKAWPMVM